MSERDRMLGVTSGLNCMKSWFKKVVVGVRGEMVFCLTFFVIVRIVASLDHGVL